MKTDFDATGDVRAVDLLAAFVSIWRVSRSGSVRFTRSGSSAGFDFADGELVGAFSSDPRFEASAILVRAGKLDAAALERLTVPPGTDGALAALQAGILTRREWKWGEKIRAIEILAELLGWPDGKYLFDFEARPSRSEFSLAIPRLVLELFLRSRDRHLIDHQLGSIDVPLTRSERFDEEFATFGLTADAESVVHLIDGEASASDICARAPAEEFAVLKLLAALRTLDLLRQESDAVSAPVLEPGLGAREEKSLISEPEGHETLPPPVSSAEEIESEAKRFSFPSIDPLPSPAVASALASELPVEEIPESESEDPALDVEIGDAVPGWEDPPARRDFESPSDDLERELDTAIEPPVPPGGGFPLGRLLWVLLAVLIVAVAGLVFLRSRRGPETLTAAGRAAARPTPSAQRSATAVAALTTPTAVVTLPAALPPTPTRPIPPTPTARSRQAKPTPVPAKPVPAKPAVSQSGEPGRAQWIARARSDRRKLDQDARTRYAIQLELACETASLAEAWKHDQPAGSMWLLAVPHQGKDCFRVLWGRFPSLEAARKAKGGAPLFFSTATNHPAVVSVR